ncbi:uncharacterized protein LOC116778995 isoform X1 [Danaus plexippus]|uniref:uncharacterized protein LOC116778995 isoform X1 n=2 Tax=Danaus plexippus TaxID=13037 RepID=UPI002AB320D1|nr:uncharacterized protein LOC116778995 isoform X1 [Danaus plexippus]
MTAMAGPRKTISIHDYPEHLNPFREEDNHGKIRFWTIGRKLSRSNSITFSGLKEFRNSWSLRSFMRKGKKNSEQTSQNYKNTNQRNGENSPVVFRRAMQYASMSRSTVGSPEQTDRYVYGGSVTPLPRSRFQERLRSSQQEVSSISATPRMARSDITGSRLSVVSTNPFDEAPVPPVRASRRKKKRAPAPPSTSAADESVTSDNMELSTSEPEDKSKMNTTIDDEINDVNLKVELKIIEDDDDKTKEATPETKELTTTEVETTQTIASEIKDTKEDNEITENHENNRESEPLKNNTEEEVVSQISFPKVDISKYRRNSSVNEDDVRLRRGNLEDFQPLINKRCKSLTNNLSDENYVSYDINFNGNKTFDINSNEEPQKVVCKVYEESRKKSLDNSYSSTEKEFLEIDKATRELEREISKLNSALIEDDFICDNTRLSVSEIRQKFDRADNSSPNPIPKPRRSNCGESSSTVNGKL